MSLSRGFQVGPYEIVAAIGHGGMGEVYRARDTRLAREVAIKFLSDALAGRRAIPQAIRTGGSRDRGIEPPAHCALHDVGPGYLVMEYIDGAPLRGPLPVPEALRLAVQIADALAAAHRSGITHRDLKPGNILVTKAGVKLLDFGLAKRAASPVGTAAEDVLTISSNLTRQGTILGTPQYMAPEQLEARDADPRSDIFAFGCGDSCSRLTAPWGSRLFLPMDATSPKNRFGTRALRYDVTPDGQRFLFPETVEEPRPAIRVVQNWFSEFRDRR